MNRTNLVVAVCFLVLGVFLVATSFSLPNGMGGLPGPGFFPQVIGAVVIVLGGLLLFQASRQTEDQSQFRIQNRGAIAGTIALAFLYLALWGTGWFALRTAVFLALFLKFLGQRWKAAVAVAAVLTAVATAAFQFGLRVSLE